MAYPTAPFGGGYPAAAPGWAPASPYPPAPVYPGPYQPPPFSGAYPIDPRFTQPPTSPWATTPNWGGSGGWGGGGWNNYGGQGSQYPNSNTSIFGPDGSIGQYGRFLQGIGMEYTWLDGNAGRDLDQGDVDLWATFALRIFPNPNHPLLVSPGFGFHLWDGPAAPEAGDADLPGVAYDAYLDAAWRPQFETVGFELAIRPGVYSDFSSINSDSIRIQGRGLAYITITPNLKIALGGIYLDRLDKKFFPAGGFVWTPHERARHEIIFPKPKAAFYMFTSARNTQWWIYFTGEYGGGSWTIDRAAGMEDRIDINDIRIAVGLDLIPTSSLDGVAPGFGSGRRLAAYFEAGYVFEREIIYDSGAPDDFQLPDTFMVRGGLRF